MMQMRSPCGIGQFLKTLAVEKSCFKEYSRITPDWRSSAAAAWSEPAKDPVCELAAEAPAAERPALSAMMGLRRVTRVASLRKLAGFWIDSM